MRKWMFAKAKNVTILESKDLIFNDEKGDKMERKAFLFLLILPFLIITSDHCWAQVYKWVDDKGTVHFSDGPPPGNLKSQDKNQEKSQVKDQNKNPEKTVDKQATQENTQAILKRLEIGNRQIPEDMKKYGPGSDSGYERPRGAEQTATTPTARRATS